MKGFCVLIALTSVLFAETAAVPAKTTIAVRTNESIDAKRPSSSGTYHGVVDSDVVDKVGRVIIPRGSAAKLTLREATETTVVLDLSSVVVNGQPYRVTTNTEAVATPVAPRKGIGVNERTGKFVGGGMVVGAIIGVLTGGPAGAAIGAAAGIGGGAFLQSTTTKQSPRLTLPPETQITFRLDQPLTVASVGGPGGDAVEN